LHFAENSWNINCWRVIAAERKARREETRARLRRAQRVRELKKDKEDRRRLKEDPDFKKVRQVQVKYTPTCQIYTTKPSKSIYTT
jgi:predicted secreted protein